MAKLANIWRFSIFLKRDIGLSSPDAGHLLMMRDRLTRCGAVDTFVIFWFDSRCFDRTSVVARGHMTCVSRRRFSSGCTRSGRGTGSALRMRRPDGRTFSPRRWRALRVDCRSATASCTRRTQKRRDLPTS